jgi:hypothetical protein
MILLESSSGAPITAGSVKAITWALQKTDDLFAIGDGRCGAKTLDLEAALALYRRVANAIKGEMAQDGEVLRDMIGPGAHLVVGEDNVHAPMEAGFNGPVLAHGVTQLCAIGSQAGDVVAISRSTFSCAAAAAFSKDHKPGKSVNSRGQAAFIPRPNRRRHGADGRRRQPSPARRE